MFVTSLIDFTANWNLRKTSNLAIKYSVFFKYIT